MKNKVILAFLCLIFSFSLFSCNMFSENPYSQSDKEMEKVRIFIGRESNNDSEYYVIKQDGYGRIQEWNIYSKEDDSLIGTNNFVYSGYIIEEQKVVSPNGKILLDRFYTLDDKGKILTQNSVFNGEISQTRFFKEDDGSDIAEEDFGVCFVKYDEFGRVVSWRERKSAEEESLTVTNFGPFGLVSEITYTNGIETYRFELTEKK